MQYNTIDIYNRIFFECRAIKASHAAISTAAGLSPGYIDSIKKGKQPGAIALARIADVLGVSVDYLLGRTPATTPTTTPATTADHAAALEALAAAAAAGAAAIRAAAGSAGSAGSGTAAVGGTGAGGSGGD